METYRCLCGQPLAAFVLPQMGLPVGDSYVRAAVADALSAHLELLDASGRSSDLDVQGVVADHHGDGEPWVLDATYARTPA